MVVEVTPVHKLMSIRCTNLNMKIAKAYCICTCGFITAEFQERDDAGIAFEQHLTASGVAIPVGLPWRKPLEPSE